MYQCLGGDIWCMVIIQCVNDMVQLGIFKCVLFNICVFDQVFVDFVNWFGRFIMYWCFGGCVDLNFVVGIIGCGDDDGIGVYFMVDV